MNKFSSKYHYIVIIVLFLFLLFFTIFQRFITLSPMLLITIFGSFVSCFFLIQNQIVEETKYLKDIYRIKHNSLKDRYNNLVDKYNNLLDENKELYDDYKDFYISVVGKEEYEKQLKEFKEKNNIKGDTDESI